MKVRQISIFLENRSGRLASVLKEVGRAGVNIRALSLADTSDFGILRLIVDDVDKGVQALKSTGHTVSLTEVLAALRNYAEFQRRALQQTLAPYNLFWPPDPSSADLCSVGGNLATNAGGPRAVKYGTARDNVLGLVAVTGTGELIRCGGAYTKDATGYDLTHLIVGSEGTLALIVEATLKLAPRPHAQAGLRVLYRDAATAAAAVSRIMARPTTPTMLEFMDRSAIALIRCNGSDVPEAGAMLLVEADGDDDTLPYALQALADAAEGEGLIALDVATDGSARDRLWAARRALSPALRTIRPGKINEDVVVPVSRIPDLVAAMEALSLEAGLPIVVFGHAGNGNLHVNIMYDDADAAETARAHAALPRVFAQVLALGGTLSGEHGIGLSKRNFMADAFSAATLDAMHAVKAALDPDGILNPGKVLPPREPL